MSKVTIFRRRASDHVDAGELKAYRDALAGHVERIEAVCDRAGEIADDLRRRIREPDEVTEALARGWSLYGHAFDTKAGVMRCGQAAVKEVDAEYDPSMKLGEL